MLHEGPDAGKPVVLQLPLVDHGEERLLTDVREQLHAAGTHLLANIGSDRLGEADEHVAFLTRLSHRADGESGLARRHLLHDLGAGTAPPDLPPGVRDDPQQYADRKNTGHDPADRPRSGAGPTHQQPTPFLLRQFRVSL